MARLIAVRSDAAQPGTLGQSRTIEDDGGYLEVYLAGRRVLVVEDDYDYKEPTWSGANEGRCE